MKKSELYKIIKNLIKEQADEEKEMIPAKDLSITSTPNPSGGGNTGGPGAEGIGVDDGTGAGPLAYDEKQFDDPQPDPDDDDFQQLNTRGCVSETLAGNPDYGDPVSYTWSDYFNGYNSWGTEYSSDGNSIDSGCHNNTINQAFICCSQLSDAIPGEIVDSSVGAQLSIPTDTDMVAFGGTMTFGDMGLENWGPSALSSTCHCPSPVYVDLEGDEAWNGDGEYLLRCDGINEASEGGFTLDDFLGWASGFIPASGGWSMVEDCVGCTFQPNTTVEVQNMTVDFDGNNADAEAYNCVFRACNAPGFTNYFCTEQPNSYLSSIQTALCDSPTTDNPYGVPNNSYFEEIIETGDCEFSGCLEDITPWNPEGGTWLLPNTNWVCTEDGGNYNPLMCDENETGTYGGVNYNGIIEDYTSLSGGVYTPIMTNTGCTQLTPIFGCGDSTMWNYNAETNVETPGGTEVSTDDDGAPTGLYVGNLYWTNATSNFDPCCPVVEGCVDQGAYNSQEITATNYEGILCGEINTGCCNDVDPNTDDGSCCYTEGCMDETMFNYNASACIQCPEQTNSSTWAISCTECIPFVFGCNDQQNADGVSSLNYNCPSIDGEIDPTCTGVETGNPQTDVNTNDGTCCYVEGCMDSTMYNYNAEACLQIDTVCEEYVYGCTDSLAYNYDESANTDDGSCIAVDEGCTNSNFQTSLGGNYSATANTDGDGFCQLEGCLSQYDANGVAHTNWICDLQDGYFCSDGNTISTYEGADEIYYTPTFTDGFNEDGTSVCTTVEIIGCTDSTYLNYSSLYSQDPNLTPEENTDTYCFGLQIPQCDDPTAYNYYCNSPNPNLGEDNALIFANNVDIIGIACTEGDPYQLLPTVDITVPDPTLPTNADGSVNYITETVTQVVGGACITAVEGCTDASAFNYAADANIDDGSCEAIVVGCMDDTAVNYNPNANTPASAVSNNACCYVAGCTTQGSFNFNAEACQDDGSCIDVVEGCTDSTAFNYNPNANTDDGSCVAVIEGCTDENFVEYDPSANTDDGSCEIIVFYGCMDEEASNYDENATVACTDPENQTNFEATSPFTLGEQILPDNPDTVNIGGEEVPCTPCEYFFDLDGDGIEDDEEVIGCQDPTANNYNPNATDPGLFGGFTNQNYIDGGCEYVVNGCDDPSSPNYYFTQIENGDIIITSPLYYNSPTDTNIIIQNPDLGGEDPCELLGGCLDPNAENFNDNSQYDNGTCVFGGCTNPLADNYNDETNLVSSNDPQYNGMVPNYDDGSCQFGSYCPVDINENGVPFEDFICVDTGNVSGFTYASLCDFSGNDPVFNNQTYLSSTNQGYVTPIDVTVSFPQFSAAGEPLWNIINAVCEESAMYGCTFNANAITTDPNTGVDLSSYHSHQDINGDGAYLAHNYDPNATDSATADNEPSKRCIFSFCPDTDAYNWNPNRPDGTGNWIVNHDIGEFDLCEYEGCAESGYGPIGNQTQDMLPNGMYFYSSENDGCQVPTTPTVGNSLHSTGDLSTSNFECCAKVGCMDDGDLNDIWWEQYNYDQMLPDTQPDYPFNVPNFEGALNYDPEATVQTMWGTPGACEYPTGCTYPEAANWDPDAVLDDGSCSVECKYIEAEQCNPPPPAFGKPYKNAYDFRYGCVTIDDETPYLNQEFLGIGNIYSQAEELEFGYSVPYLHHIEGPAQEQGFGFFGTPGDYNGQIITEPNTGFMYMWGAGESAWVYNGVMASGDACYNDPYNPVVGLIPGGSDIVIDCVLYNSSTSPQVLSGNEMVQHTGVGTGDKPKPAQIIGKQYVVYRITKIEPRLPVAEVENYQSYSCDMKPPNKPVNTSLKPIDENTSIDEVNTSRKLRTSLIENILGYSEKDKVEDLIRETIAKIKRKK